MSPARLLTVPMLELIAEKGIGSSLAAASLSSRAASRASSARRRASSVRTSSSRGSPRSAARSASCRMFAARRYHHGGTEKRMQPQSAQRYTEVSPYRIHHEATKTQRLRGRGPRLGVVVLENGIWAATPRRGELPIPIFPRQLARNGRSPSTSSYLCVPLWLVPSLPS